MVCEPFELAAGVGMYQFCHRNVVGTEMTTTFKSAARTAHDAILVYIHITNSVKEGNWNILEVIEVANVHVSSITVNWVLK